MTRRKREDTAARRKIAIDMIVEGPFKMVPWGWDRETETEGQVPIEKARRVRCGLCAVTWRYNQGAYMTRHYQKHHGWTYGQALDGWLGGSRADRQRAHDASRAAIDALLKGEG